MPDTDTQGVALEPKAVAAAVIAHDNEENAQRGEPKAWSEPPTDDESGEWAERLFCMEEAIRAYLSAAQEGRETVAGAGALLAKAVWGVNLTRPAPAQPAAQVVKGLEWKEGTYTTTDDDGGPMEGVPFKLFAWRADQYVIIRQKSADGLFILRGTSDGVGKVVATLHAAKAAAQADYERRILSALASPTDADAAVAEYFDGLVERAKAAAAKASEKFPQPNYVTLKIAEEAGEVVRGAVHYAENRMEWQEVEGEIVQLLAMLIRFVTEGDQVNGIAPPLTAAKAGEDGRHG